MLKELMEQFKARIRKVLKKDEFDIVDFNDTYKFEITNEVTGTLTEKWAEGEEEAVMKLAEERCMKGYDVMVMKLVRGYKFDYGDLEENG